jgi:hypothetical protein
MSCTDHLRAQIHFFSTDDLRAHIHFPARSGVLTPARADASHDIQAGHALAERVGLQG